MFVRFHSEKILKKGDSNLSANEVSSLTGLTAAEITNLCKLELIPITSNRGIQFSTLIKLKTGLGIDFSELIELVEPNFLDLVRGESGLTIAVGSRPCLLLGPDEDKVGKNGRGPMVQVTEGARRDAIGIWDMRALAEITRKCPWHPPNIVETPCTLTKGARDLPNFSHLLQSEGVVIGLGSPLVSGLADRVLLKLQRLFGNAQHPLNIPFQFWWDFIGNDNRNFHKFVGPGNPQGISWSKDLLVQIPSWQAIKGYPQGQSYDDGCVLVVWPNKTNGRRTWIALVMGFMGPGTMAGASFLFSDSFGNILSEYFAEPTVISERKDPAPPLFVALKVVCEKQGGSGSRDVFPVREGNGFKVEVVGHHIG